LKDQSFSLREFCVSLLGMDFDLSLFQLLKFQAGHDDLFRKVLRQSECRADRSVLRDISPQVITIPDICCYAPQEQDTPEQGQIYDPPRARAHVVCFCSGYLGAGFRTRGMCVFDKSAFIR
jgi:hypothetical protein